MSLKSSNKIETNVYELEISISAEDFNAAVLKTYNKNKGKISVPGWRKGKAPKHLIETIYGKDVFYDDALEMLYPGVVDAAIAEAGITAVDSPHDVDVKEIGENGVEITMKVTVKPEITVTEYKGLEGCKHPVEVADSEVDAEIERLRKRGGTVTTVEDRAALDGDTAVIDFEGFVDGVAFEGGKGENHDLVLGSGQFIPGFEEQIVGHNTGDEFDVNVTFPEDYSPELAGQDAVFKVKLNEIKATVLPELDDEFAKDVSEEAETLDELKNNIKTDMQKSRQEHSDADFENEVLMKLAENVEGEIPQCMFDKKASENMDNFARRLKSQGIADVDMYLMYMGIEKEQFEEDMMAQAVQQIKVRLALEKVATTESIEIADEDLAAEYDRLVGAYGVSADSVKSFFAEETVRGDLLCEKAIKVILEHATVCEHKHDEDSENDAEA
ncbi:MAG: trigger factor [Oscillospiraceae bacterium]|nr:trigger factor [Oscillospiraceae bacterium]